MAPVPAVVAEAGEAVALETGEVPIVISDVDFDIDDGAEARKVAAPVVEEAPPARPVAAALPLVPATTPTPVELAPTVVTQLLERIESLSKEARAIAAAGPDTAASAAPLWYEAGRLYEHELGNNRDAAIHYQESHKADPTYVPVMHAARRLFGQLGKWGMVVLLIDEELRLPGAPTTSLLIEKARISEGKLGRADDALDLYRQVLQADPANPIAVDAVIRTLGARGDHAGVVEVLLAGVAGTERQSLKGAWLLEAARLAETRLGDDARALALVEQANTLLPNRRPVLQMIRRLAARAGDQARLGAALDALADSARNATESVSFLTEQARALAAGAVDGDDSGLRQAVGALEEARARAPQDALVLAELARLYERLEMWSSLADTVEARALLAQETQEKLAYTADAARIAEERLGETERAIRLYRTCVELDATDPQALSSLGRLFAKTQRFEDLSHVYDVQVRAAGDTQQKIPLLFKQAELHAHQLNDVDGACAKLQEILELSPGYVPAANMAAQLYARLERWADLIALWEAELGQNPDKEQALYVLEKIATTWEDKLGDVDNAVATHQRMLKIQPGYLPALRSLSRLYRQAERWEELLAVNLEEAQAVADQGVVVSLYCQNGEVLTDKLGRTDDAIDAFNRALQLMPTYLPALRALGGIYARAGRFQDLVAMHRAEAEVARQAHHRAQLLFMAGELTEHRLQDLDGAVATYQEVLAEDPGHHAARRALVRIAQRRNDAEMLYTLMEGQLQTLRDPRERALHRCGMAELLEHRLGRVDDAVAALDAAVEEAGGVLLAHEQRISLHSRRGNPSAEAEARERMQAVLPDDDGRLANLRALADLWLHRLDDPQKAREAAERLLQIVPGDRPARRVALSCSLRLRDYRGALAAAEALAAVEPSADEVCNLHLQMATWKEAHIDPPEDSLPHYVRMLEFVPQHPIALRALERLYVERHAWEALYALYEHESTSLTAPEMVVANAMKMGELAEYRLGRLDAARASYERVLSVQSDYLPAISRLKEIYGAEGRPQDQLRLLTLEAQTSKDPAHAIRTLLEVGALHRDKFGDVNAAVECFTHVLQRDPLHAQAYPALEGLLLGADRWAELARLYERRASAVDTPPQRIELLLRAAHIARERLQRNDEAARLYAAVVALAPGHEAALTQLGHLRFEMGDHAGALEAYGALLPVATDPMSLVPVHHHLGVIFTDHLPDPARAVQHLTAALSMAPERRDTRQLLARAYGLAGSPAQALQTYRQLVETATAVSEQKDLHIIIARIHQGPLPDAAAAATHLEVAMNLAEDKGEQARLLDELATAYEVAGNLAGLVESTSRQAESLAGEQPRRAAELHFRNARMALERLQNPDQALRSARRALDLAPDVVEVRGFVADLYSRMPNQQLLAVEEHRRILRAGRVRVASLKALYRGFSQQRAHDRAFCAAEILSFLAAADDAEELFFTDNKKRVKKDSGQGLLATQVTSWLAHPNQRNAVREILALVAFDLGKPFARDGLEDLDKKFILRPKTVDPLRSLADNMANNLGISGFDVWRSQSMRSGVEAWTASPPVLLVGQDVTRTHPNREQRFLLGRKLMALASGHHLLHGLNAQGLGLLLTAIGRVVDKTFPALAVGDAVEVEALMKRVSSGLARRTKSALQEPVSQLAAQPRSVDLDAYLAAIPLSENRAGLVLAGAYDAAARLIARDTGSTLTGDSNAMIAAIEANAQLSDLTAFQLSDEHFQARQALQLAIDS